MGDIDDLRARFLRSTEAWTTFDADVVAKSGVGNGFGYRVRDARSRGDEDLDETRRRLEVVFGAYETFKIRDIDWHATIEGDVAIEWGFFTEEFQNKGLDPEVVRVRFSIIHRRQDEQWIRVWEHRDAQPFDADGRYLRDPPARRTAPERS